MPLVVLADKYSILVHTNDHRPVHCHVKWEGKEIKVSLPDYRATKISKAKKIKLGEIKEILEIVKVNRKIIGQEWRRIHGD